VRQKVHEAISLATGGFLDRPVGSILESGVTVSHEADIVSPIIADFLRSEHCNAALVSVFATLLPREQLLDRSIGELAPSGTLETIAKRLEDFITLELTEKSSKITERMLPALERLYPKCTGDFIRFLKKPGIHTELEVQGRIFLSSAIMKLNVFQRFFISAGQYDRTLHERIPEIIDDLIVQLDGLLSDGAFAERITAFAGDTLKRVFAGEDSAQKISRFVRELAMAQTERPIRDLLHGAVLPGAGALIGKLRAVSGEEKDGFLRRLGGNLSVETREQPLRAFLLIDDAKKESVDALITAAIVKTASSQIEGALDSINVKTLVSERIDSLEMIRVERIVLDVMANQLKWIDIFGGLLGFLIGLFQAFLSWFLR
jgi:hypothetical protein